MILANQTASSPELLDAARKIIEKDGNVEFVLLVPATPIEDLLDWQNDTSEAVAKRTGEEAKKHLEGVGGRVVRVECRRPVSRESAGERAAGPS